MAVRLSGMVSGLDTDALVKELVSAYSTKKDKVVKNQTKLSWTQDAWKSMNTKIYSFYTNKLAAMRLSGSYNKKTATVSNSSVAKVTASSNAVNGTQKMQIKRLATSGYMTGGVVEGAKDKLNAKSKLTDIKGMESFKNGSVEVKVDGNTTRINVNEDTTISQFVNQLKDAGVNASFDETNQRFFISSKKSGEAGDFAITGSDASGTMLLQKAGLFSLDKDSAELAKYKADAELDIDEAVKKAYDAQMTKDTDAETEKKILEEQKKALTSQVADLAKNQEYLEAKKQFLDMDIIQTGTVTVKDEEGNDVEQPTYDYASPDTRSDKIASVTQSKEDMEAELQSLNEKEELSDSDKTRKASLENMIKAADDALYELQMDTYVADDYKRMSEEAEKSIASNQEKLTKAETDLAYAENVLGSEAAMTEHVNKKNVEIADNNAKLKDSLEKYYTDLKAMAQDVVTQYGSNPDSAGKAFGAIKITGVDSEIVLNGATFKNNTNTFQINGLTIQATAVTGDEEVTITTDTDVDGIYDMIKDFFSSYNELIKSMDSAYNATSAKGYEPLTDEEKEAMSDSEIEKWETKIKDSLLRRDSTLGSISSMMKTLMSSVYEVGDKKYSLASFGITTENYFSAGDNEKGVYHIAGDQDDSKGSASADKLRAAIASDPDTVIGFFSKLSTKVYTELTKKMSSSTLSSAYTVYNDKQMTKEYSQYSSEIKDWEQKIKDYEDRYFKQFAAMEKALSSLNSQTSSLTGLLG